MDKPTMKIVPHCAVMHFPTRMTEFKAARFMGG